MPFRDRSDAGRQLAQALKPYEARRPVILALPRGGVPVAVEVAAALKAPLDLALVRKIGVPGQPELAMGAVMDSDPPVIVRNEEVIRQADIDDATFAWHADGERREIERRRRLYLGGRARLDVSGRTVIVVDDGIATGATAKAALRALRLRHPGDLVLAVPVAPRDALAELAAEADKVVCVERPSRFGAVGAFYDDFRQVGDAEVVAILERFSADGQ